MDTQRDRMTRDECRIADVIELRGEAIDLCGSRVAIPMAAHNIREIGNSSRDSHEQGMSRGM